MKLALVVFAAAGTALAAPKASSSEETSYAVRMADSYIRRGVELRYKYDQATFYTGLEGVLALYPNETMEAWYKSQIDGILVDNGNNLTDWRPDYLSLDDLRIGNNMLWWYERTGEDKYKNAATMIWKRLNRQPRTPLGGFFHRDKVYNNQMWLDGIFMADTFYAKWISLFDNSNTTAWDDIAHQYELIYERTRLKSKLLVHGYDESKKASWADPETGAAPLVWSRALGWYFWSLTETLDVIPKSHRGYGSLKKIFVSVCEGLSKADKHDGGWWLIMNGGYPGEERNYIEASAHAMFTHGFLRGIHMGLIEDKKYGELATKAWNYMNKEFVVENSDGTLNFTDTVAVGSLGSDASYGYYVGIEKVVNDKRGGGAYLRAAYEWEQRK